jgi:hypothetical protein
VCSTLVRVQGGAVCAALIASVSLKSPCSSDCRVGDTGAVALAVALEKNTTLRTLHVGKEVGDAGASALAAALEKNTTLQYLHFFREYVAIYLCVKSVQSECFCWSEERSSLCHVE